MTLRNDPAGRRRGPRRPTCEQQREKPSRRPPMRRIPKPAFTLIELLVVVAVIAILAGILFPVFARAREQARKATCMSLDRGFPTELQPARRRAALLALLLPVTGPTPTGSTPDQ